MLSARLSILKDEILSSETNTSKINVKHGIDSTKRSSDDCMNSICQHKKTDLITFGKRTIQRGRCMKHSRNNHTIYNGIDLESGSLVIVSEWIIHMKNETTMKKNLEEIKTEMNRLLQLDNPYLVNYYAMKCTTNKKTITIHLLRDFIFGTNCYNFIMNQNFKIDTEFLKHVARSILYALDNLHKHNLVHGNLKGTSVYMNENGDVKISNPGIYRRLTNLSVRKDKYNKESDIYRLGIILLSLTMGQNITRKGYIIPPIDPNLHDFLNRCLSDNLCDRHTTIQLLNHKFLQEKCIPSLPWHSPLSPSPISGRQSRVKDDFEILQQLGKGGFGKVLKVKNKLDDRYYAVKIIELNPKDKKLNEKMMREVRLLSRLNHENVVRYSTSWIEPTEREDTNTPSDTSKTSTIMEEDSYSESIVFDYNHQIVPMVTESLYIQMEFCENNTLKTVINSGSLYSDKDRIFRLFREIVEGLNYIHKQDMIHRDLKPDNIFLNAGDHVKIGDFGLAISMKSHATMNSIRSSSLQSLKDSSSESGTHVVGTALYRAPEIEKIVRIEYDEKTDIYSLGIILFEMCYAPFPTIMEKYIIINNLRRAKVIFPDNFDSPLNKKQAKLIRPLLNHKKWKRPDSDGILRSKLILEPEKEVDKLKAMISNIRTEEYRRIYATLSRQPAKAIQHSTYDKDTTIENMIAPSRLQDYVKEICQRIFERHGGQNLTTPLLMPKSTFYNCVNSCVNLMTSTGNQQLRHDHRIPFARFIAKNDITFMRRYCIEKVYREGKNKKLIETYEGAFDIVSTSNGNLTHDAEVIYVICEILHEMPEVKDDPFIIEINHTKLLKAILIHHGISEDKHRQFFATVSQVESGKVSKYKLQKYLSTLDLSKRMISSLLFYFSKEEWSIVVGKISSEEMSEEVKQLVHEAKQDIDKIIQKGRQFGIKYNIRISLGLLHNANQYSGVLFQFVRNQNVVIAAGGRYDSMLTTHRSSFQKSANIPNDAFQQFAVGVSIFFTTLVQEIQDNQPQKKCLDNYVAVHSIGNQESNLRRYEIMRLLWSVGIKSILVEGTNRKETRQQIIGLHITHEVILHNNGFDYEIITQRCNGERSGNESITGSLSAILKKTSEGCSSGFKPPIFKIG